MRKWIYLKLTILTGILASVYLPAFLRPLFLGYFAKSFQINLEECEHSLSYYSSFDAFFTRKLKPECRPLSDTPHALLSPVDGLVLESGKIHHAHLIQAKGLFYPLSELLGNLPVDSFEGGYFMTIYLSPRDCHLIFSPCEGRVFASQYVPGDLLPVREPYISGHKGLYIQNERLTSFIKTEAGKKVALVKVGAVNVGSISLEYDPYFGSDYSAKTVMNRNYHYPFPVSKGQHLASFHLGSTVIVLVERDSFVLDSSLKGQHIKYGSEIGV